ncbi:MAG: MFS transporter [Spirochaetota bacterium]
MLIEKFPLSRQIFYAIGQLGWSLLINLISTWLVYFYLPPREAGLPILITDIAIFAIFNTIGLVSAVGRLWDAVTDPLIANMSDRANTRFGRRIPFLAAGTLPAAFFCALVFMPPDNYLTTRNLVWMVFVLLGFYTFLTVYVTPYFALIPELGHTQNERLNISTYISITYFLGIAIAAQAPAIWNGYLVLPDSVSVSAYAAEKKQLYTAGSDGKLNVYDAKGKQIRQFQVSEGEVTGMDISPQGDEILIGTNDKKLHLWTPEGKQKVQFEGSESAISTVLYAKEKGYVLAGTVNGKVLIWNTAGKSVLKTKVAQGKVHAMALSPQGDKLLTSGSGKSVILWNLDESSTNALSKQREYIGHNDVIRSLAFSPSGNEFVSGSKDKTVKVWDIETGTINFQYNDHTATVGVVRFIPGTSDRVLSIGSDRKAKIWDTKGKQYAEYSGNFYGSNSLQFSKDGKIAYFGSFERTFLHVKTEESKKPDGIITSVGMSKVKAIKQVIGALCLFAAFCMIFPVFAVNEKKYCHSEPSTVPFKEALKMTFKNKSFIYFASSDFAYFLSLTVLQSGLVYYITVLLGQEESLSGLLFIVLGGFSFLLYPVVNILAKKIGKKPLVIVGFAVFFVLFLFVYILGFTWVPLPAKVQAFLVVFIAAIPMAILGILPNAILADIAELDAIKTGSRREGLFYAARTLMQKFGQTFGILVFSSLLLLGRSGENPLGVRLTGPVAALFCMAAILLFMKYNEKETLEEIDRSNSEGKL